MGSIVKGLFGGTKSTPSRQQDTSVTKSGFIGLPEDLQDYYRGILSQTSELVETPDQYFQPIGLSAEELQAQQLLNPQNIQGSIQQYLNPFQARIEEDINRQFEAPTSALTQRAAEAGAFGGSRQRAGQTDLERARLDALAGASANQYNTAYDQLQGGISNLLGFGGLQRDLDLQQRQALPSALNFASNIFSPLLNVQSQNQQGTQVGANTQTSGGLISNVGKLAGFASGLGSLFSDRNVKENIILIGEENGYPIYEFSYLDEPEKRFIGVMAQDVEKITPQAVTEINGIKAVNYDMIGVEMREVA